VKTSFLCHVMIEHGAWENMGGHAWRDLMFIDGTGDPGYYVCKQEALMHEMAFWVTGIP
jgi:hypothetical protein